MERARDGENSYKAAVRLVIEDRIGRQAGRFDLFIFIFRRLLRGCLALSVGIKLKALQEREWAC